MAEESTSKKGQLAAAVLAGSALVFSSFAAGVPAALADEESSPSATIETASPDDATTEAPADDTTPAPAETEGDEGSDTDTEQPGDSETGEVSDSPEVSEEPEEPTAPTNEDQTSETTESVAPSQLDDVDEEDIEVAPQLYVSPGSGSAGDTITFRGTGFTPEGDVEVILMPNEGSEALDSTSIQADERGQLEDNQLTIPEEADHGLYAVVATDVESDLEASALFNVTAATMSVSPGSVTEDEFRDPGVTVIVEGLEAGEVVEFELSSPFSVLPELGGSATANEDGIAEYVVQGADDVFVGLYGVRAVLADSQAEVATGEFEVTSELPQVSTSSPDAIEDGAVPHGGLLYVTGYNVTAEDFVTIDFGLNGVDEERVETSESGTFGTEITIPEDATPGDKTLRVTDEATGNVSTTKYTVAEAADEVTPTLSADRSQILLDDFVGDRDDEPGVHFTVEGLEADTEITYTATASGPVADLAGTTTADADGIARFPVFGNDSVEDPSVYLGRYSVEVTYEDESGDTQELGPVTFRVVEELVEGPQIDLESTEVYQGGALDVEIWNLTAGGEVEVQWNPTEILTADGNGEIDTELEIADNAATGVQTLTVTDLETEESASVEYTVLDAADEITEPTLNIDPERIELDEFIGDPDDGAGVAHVVEGLEAGTEITYVITGPEYVNDFENTATADDDGVASFVIHGYDVADPAVYLGDYDTVVTYVDDEGDAQTLTGGFTVVDGDDDSTGGTGGSDDVADNGGSTGPVDLNGTSDLAQTGANGIQLGLLVGGLLLAGGALLAFANRKRLFGRTA